MPKQSDLFGNPQIDPIPRADVAKFYRDFLGTPGPINHGQTINGYWMEQSRGKVGIPPIDAFGPYRMPKNLFQYGLNEWGQAGGCPGGFTCNTRMEPDVDALWLADAGADIKSKYDIVLRIYAGYDETSVWQEFGEMKFASKEDIPAEWGNPDTSMPRWVATRYVPWTTWKAGQMQWGLSSVRQGENSGTITHEIAHFAFRTGDNNNNPYATPYRRVGSGPWDIMDRGSFNGPGGPHRRWVVPATEGAAMPAGFMLRNRMRYEFVPAESVLTLNRNGLAASGLAVATITARAVEPGPGALAGVSVVLDGDAPQDRTPPCDMTADPLCAGQSVFNFYTVEVVQRIGYDSFTPDNGVLIAKNKNTEGQSCGYNCFTWVIDAHPEDINMLDFIRPDGTRVMRTPADYRQLNDALFHAGTPLRQRVRMAGHRQPAPLLRDRPAEGRQGHSVLYGRRPIARRRRAAGARRDGVGAGEPGGCRIVHVQRHAEEYRRRCTRRQTPSPHPQDAAPYLTSDIYRVSVSIDRPEWSASLQNALVAVKVGESIAVPVHVTRGATRAGESHVRRRVGERSDEDGHGLDGRIRRRRRQ